MRPLTDDLLVLPMQDTLAHLHLHHGHNRGSPLKLQLGVCVGFPKMEELFGFMDLCPTYYEWGLQGQGCPWGSSQVGAHGGRLRYKILRWVYDERLVIASHGLAHNTNFSKTFQGLEGTHSLISF